MLQFCLSLLLSWSAAVVYTPCAVQPIHALTVCSFAEIWGQSHSLCKAGLAR